MSEQALSAPGAVPAPLAVLARRPFATLFLLCLLAWLPGFSSLPPLDRDEARFAQASKQMVETGNLVDIRFGAEARYKKPVGIYWLQAAATKLFGQPPYNAIWTYRLPSLIGAVLAVFLAFWCVSALAPPGVALVGAALLVLTLGLTAEAHIAKTDAVLLAAVMAAEGVLIRIYLAARDAACRPPGFGLVLAGWAAVAVGVLIKGPVILAVLGLTALAVSLWDRDGRWLGATRPLLGIAFALLVVLPWFITIGLQTHGQFFRQALGHDFAAKLVGGEESHGAPPGYYILLSTLTLWPATLFALPGFGSAIAKRRKPQMRFLLSWAGATWLMFALVPTKLPHYILPAYPALVFLAALWLVGGNVEVETRMQKALRYAGGVQFAIGVLALAAAIAVAPVLYGKGTALLLDVFAAMGAVAGLGAVVALFMRRRMAAALAAVLTALIFYPTVMWGVAPRLTKIWISPRVAALVATDRLPGDPPVVTAGYDEPSLIFLLGTHTRIATGAGAGDIAARDGGLALIEDRLKSPFLRELALRGASAVAVDQLSGINYSRGKPVHITVYRVTPAPRAAALE